MQIAGISFWDLPPILLTLLDLYMLTFYLYHKKNSNFKGTGIDDFFNLCGDEATQKETPEESDSMNSTPLEQV